MGRRRVAVYHSNALVRRRSEPAPRTLPSRAPFSFLLPPWVTQQFIVATFLSPSNPQSPSPGRSTSSGSLRTESKQADYENLATSPSATSQRTGQSPQGHARRRRGSAGGTASGGMQMSGVHEPLCAPLPIALLKL